MPGFWKKNRKKQKGKIKPGFDASMRDTVLLYIFTHNNNNPENTTTFYSYLTLLHLFISYVELIIDIGRGNFTTSVRPVLIEASITITLD